MRELFREHYHPSEVLEWDDDPGKNAFLADRHNLASKHLFVGGHVLLAQLHDIADQFDHIITTVRHPAERFVSMYAYIRWSPWHDLYKPAYELSMVDFLREYIFPVFTNEQCTYLGESTTFASVLEAMKRFPHITPFAVDHLDADFPKFCQKIGVLPKALESPEELAMPQANAAKRARRGTASDLYCAYPDLMYKHTSDDVFFYEYVLALHGRMTSV